ncbi:MAG: hypothetical protein QNJ77_05405 [Acidimicrobiia bacterium]|nr:hypothetical protein [Acidimicrobiia bacterium]
MKKARTITASVLATLALATPSHAVATSGEAVSIAAASVAAAVQAGKAAIGAQPGTVVVGGTQTQRATAAWAISRFEEAGLVVPPLEIYLHSDPAGCKGHRGIFNAGEQRVDVCVEEPGVMLHEIAHAWNWVNLTDAQRAEYVEKGGFGSWDDPETPWHDRGSEDAADAIAWALLEEPIAGFTADGPIARTNASYRLLTGMDSPRISG